MRERLGLMSITNNSTMSEECYTYAAIKVKHSSRMKANDQTNAPITSFLRQTLSKHNRRKVSRDFCECSWESPRFHCAQPHHPPEASAARHPMSVRCLGPRSSPQDMDWSEGHGSSRSASFSSGSPLRFLYPPRQKGNLLITEALL